MLKVKKNKIIIDSHADNIEECNTLTSLANALQNSKDFKTIDYRNGYAEFESVSQNEDLKFPPLEPMDLTFIWQDSHIRSVSCSGVAFIPDHIWTASGETFTYNTNNLDSCVFNVELDEGYVLETVISSNDNYKYYSVDNQLVDDNTHNIMNVYSENQIYCSAYGTVTITCKPKVILDIPNGYRLLNESDAGKSFNSYDWKVDKNAIPNLIYPTASSLFYNSPIIPMIVSYNGGNLTIDDTNLKIYDKRNPSSVWIDDNLSIFINNLNTSDTIIESIHLVAKSGTSWNNWLYVKELENLVFNGTNCISDLPLKITEGESGVILADEGYRLPVEIEVTNAQYSYNNSTGEITLSNITGDVTITAVAEIDPEAKVAVSLANLRRYDMKLKKYINSFFTDIDDVLNTEV